MQQINRPYEGLFITIEGGDGCGKSSLCDPLVDKLQNKGYSILKTREPGGTSFSEYIRSLLLDSHERFSIGAKAELFLFLAARVQHMEETIFPALRVGKIVVCERFNDSTIAYQGCARGLGFEYVQQICDSILEPPDLTLLLDIDPTEGIRRKKSQKNVTDRIEKEDIQFHSEVRRAFLFLADENPHRITILDATLPLEEILNHAMQVIEPHLKIKI